QGPQQYGKPKEVLPKATIAGGKQQIYFFIDTNRGEQVFSRNPVISNHGAVALCVNAGEIKLIGIVLPIILRIIQMIGINSD
ncbi:NADPH:quinone reductase, partial [Enterococcus lactis]|nr:NADPH:quinone reductase [Enterococcus lactis]